MSSPLEALRALILSREPEVISLQRELHAHPELSHHEHRTTQTLVGLLRGAGLSPIIRPQGTGFFADIAQPDFDPARHITVAIRADLDALPIHEDPSHSPRSSHDGVMHACGHDAHMAAVTGAALGLIALRDALPGRVRLLYQHAEESSPSGAPEMVAAGAMNGVDWVLGLHCDPERLCGKVGVRIGPLTASFDQFTIQIHGKGGHGARPHQCVDPIFIATQLAQALYHFPSRQLDARQAAVLSIGELHAGHAPNVIPEIATIRGTIRTLTTEHRAQVEPALRRLVHHTCEQWGASASLDLYRGAPPVINHPEASDALRDAALSILPVEDVEHITLPSMGSEDFAHLLARAPGAMFRLGTASPERPIHLLHTPRFQIDERALVIGSQILASAAWSLLDRGQRVSL